MSSSSLRTDSTRKNQEKGSSGLKKEPLVVEAPAVYVCAVCAASFSSDAAFVKHVKTHDDKISQTDKTFVVCYKGDYKAVTAGVDLLSALKTIFPSLDDNKTGFITGFENGDPNKKYTFELNYDSCQYLAKTCNHGGLLTISTNGKRKRRPEEMEFSLLKAGIPLSNESGVLANNIKKAKSIMDALIPNGSKRIQMDEIKCPCCEKAIKLKYNGGICGLKSHLQRSKKPESKRLLDRLTVILEGNKLS